MVQGGRMYTVGSVVRFITQNPSKMRGRGGKILARAYNSSAQGLSVISGGEILGVFGGDVDLTGDFDEFALSEREVLTGLSELAGEVHTTVPEILGIFFKGEVPEVLTELLEVAEPDPILFSDTLHAELTEIGIELAPHVRFKLERPPQAA